MAPQGPHFMNKPRIAILIPCYNEELTIANVVNEFRETLPESLVYVYDNDSSDQTISCAAKAGAIVMSEPRRGKGEVVRRMFADIDADIYIISDGDGTYDISSAPKLIQKLISENLDMVVGARKEETGRNKSKAAEILGFPNYQTIDNWIKKYDAIL